MQAACICTEVAMNSYQFIVSPLMVKGSYVDALTLCAFHDQYKDLEGVMDFPIMFMSSWMQAQYIAQMPRTLFAPVGSIAVVSCIGKDGQPTQLVPGQNACYYENAIMFELNEDSEMKTSNNWYYGPFLGTQLPNFAKLAQHSESKISTLDFATVFDFVKCSMLKTKTRLTPGIIETGCKFRAYPKDWSKLVTVQCCCDGHNDPNCAEVTAAVKEKQILCFDGTLTANAQFYFADKCPYTVTKSYKRIIPTTHVNELQFEHAQAVVPETADVAFNNNDQCFLNATTCDDTFVHVVEKRCCGSEDFCGVHHGLMGIDRQCYWSFGEDGKDDGCFAIFYRADGE